MLRFNTENLSYPKYLRMALPPPIRGRPTDVEIREHVRNWFLHLQKEWGLNGKEMARAVGISGAMVTNIKQGGDPGIDTLVGLHYAFRESMSRMVSENPPAAIRAHK